MSGASAAGAPRAAAGQPRDAAGEPHGAAPWSERRLREPGGAAVTVHELDGPAPGPTVVVLGAVHGDEPEGVLGAGRLTGPAGPRGLTRGRLRVVPVVNEPAFAAFARRDPADGGDLARTFPGDPDGGPSERLAALVRRELLAGADLLVDLHTAGRLHDMPPLAGYVDDGGESGRRGRAAAVAFGLPLVWRHTESGPGRTLTVMHERGLPAVYAECPGGATVDARWSAAYTDGVLRVLDLLGMLDGPAPAPAAPGRQRHVTGGGNLDVDVLRAARAGLWQRAQQAVPGEPVSAGQPLGELLDVRGRVLETVAAPRDGVLMLLRREAPAVVGDVVAGLADEEGAPPADGAASAREEQTGPRQGADRADVPDGAAA